MSEFSDHEYRAIAKAIALPADTFIEVLGGDTLPADLLNKLRVRPPEISIGLGRAALHFAETTVDLKDELDRFVFHALALSVNNPIQAHKLMSIGEKSTLIDDSKKIRVKLSRLKMNINRAAGASVVYSFQQGTMPSKYIFRAVDFWQVEPSSNELFEQMEPTERLAFIQQARHLFENGAPRK